jgi:hypothetical protein
MSPAELPLASCCQFASNDFDAMHHRLSTLLKPHRLRRLSNVPVTGIIHRATLKRISFNVLRIGPSVDVWPNLGSVKLFGCSSQPVSGAAIT